MKKGAINILLVLIFSLIILTVAVLLMSGRVQITGGATGIARVTVQCFVAISLPNSVVDFGGVFPGDKDNTTDDSPLPLLVQNDGSARVNVTIARDAGSSPLFNGTGGGDSTNSFMFKAGESNETGSFDLSASASTFTPVPGTTAVLAIALLNFTDSADLAEIELLIDVPSDEPPGDKEEVLNIIGLLADAQCPGEEDDDDDEEDDE